MLDSDLAELYGVPTKALNQAVKRNKERFPGDFMFQLTKEEKEEVVTNRDYFLMGAVPISNYRDDSFEQDARDALSARRIRSSRNRNEAGTTK